MVVGAGDPVNDKQKIRDSRAALLDRLKKRAYNPKEDETNHVFERSLPAKDVKTIVDSIAKLNAMLKDWQD